MKRCVVVGASSLNINLKDYINNTDFIIAADKGWEYCFYNEITPNLVVGDFDSSKKPENLNTIVLPKEKDDTDTFFIARYIIENKFSEVLFIALSGGKRFEHTLANIQTMNFLSKNNIKAVMIDEYSKMIAVNNERITLEKEENSYFSLVSFGIAKGVSIKGAQYEIENATITDDYPIGISNEFKEKSADIEVKDGSLLIIITKKD